MPKMKKNLKYSLEDCMYQTAEGLMEVRIQHVTFSKVPKIFLRFSLVFSTSTFVFPTNNHYF